MYGDLSLILPVPSVLCLLSGISLLLAIMRVLPVLCINIVEKNYRRAKLAEYCGVISKGYCTYVPRIKICSRLKTYMSCNGQKNI